MNTRPLPLGAGIILKHMTIKSGSVLSIILLLVLSTAQAQFLPVGGSGKCEVTEVVLAEGFPRTFLFTNDLTWFKTLPRSDAKLSTAVKDSVEGKVSANYEFLVYAQSGILRKVAGSVSYHINVETKDGKYRYSFTDFVYHYYAQNRNYQMVKTGSTKLLEETKARGWQKLWTEHRRTVFALVNNQVNDLKVKMVETPKPLSEKEEKKVEW